MLDLGPRKCAQMLTAKGQAPDGVRWSALEFKKARVGHNWSTTWPLLDELIGREKRGSLPVVHPSSLTPYLERTLKGRPCLKESVKCSSSAP
jgi:hypothetical protein